MSGLERALEGLLGEQLGAEVVAREIANSGRELRWRSAATRTPNLSFPFWCVTKLDISLAWLAAVAAQGIELERAAVAATLAGRPLRASIRELLGHTMADAGPRVVDQISSRGRASRALGGVELAEAREAGAGPPAQPRQTRAFSEWLSWALMLRSSGVCPTDLIGAGAASIPQRAVHADGSPPTPFLDQLVPWLRRQYPPTYGGFASVSDVAHLYASAGALLKGNTPANTRSYWPSPAVVQQAAEFRRSPAEDAIMERVCGFALGVMSPLTGQQFGAWVSRSSYGMAGGFGTSFALVDLDAGLAVAAAWTDVDFASQSLNIELRAEVSDVVAAAFL